MTYQNRLVANAQTACTMLLGKEFQGKQLYKMIFVLLFISIGGTSQYVGVPYDLKLTINSPADLA